MPHFGDEGALSQRADVVGEDCIDIDDPKGSLGLLQFLQMVNFGLRSSQESKGRTHPMLDDDVAGLQFAPGFGLFPFAGWLVSNVG